MSDELSQDDRQSMAFFVRKIEAAQALVNVFAEHLCQKYGIQPPDQLMMDGRIVRAAKDTYNPSDIEGR